MLLNFLHDTLTYLSSIKHYMREEISHTGVVEHLALK